MTRPILFALAALAAASCARPAPPSVLLVTIDTLRADRVGLYGGPAGLTPAFDALGAQGVVFDEARASTPLTLPSHATMFTGLEPLRHGVRDNGAAPLDPSRDTIATRFGQRGYATAAFVGAFVLDRRFGLARGFEHYDDRIDRGSNESSAFSAERRCADVGAAASEWLGARSPGPFFAWVHFYDPHAPYEPPHGAGHAWTGKPYEGEIAATDACLAQTLTAARRAAGERLIVAVLADHGEGLGDHGEPTHGLFVYDSTLRIPFVLAGPGVPRGERRPGLARTVDLMPTLLKLAGLEAQRGDGVDLLANPPVTEAYAETWYPASFGWSPLFSVRAGSLKYIAAPAPELFDLANDRLETRNLVTERAGDTVRLASILTSARGSDRGPAAATVDAATAEKLRSLGYVAASVRPEAAGPTVDPKLAVAWWRAFDQASVAESRGDLTAAERGYRDVLARDPANAVFRRSLARAQRRLRRFDDAARTLRAAHGATSDAALLFDLSLALAGAGRTQQALDAADAALGLDSRHVDARLHRGSLLARAGRIAEAVRDFERVERDDPNNPQAASNLGNALQAEGRPAEAEAAFRRAASLSPKSADAWNGLALLALAGGRLDESRRLFERALAVEPGFDEARMNLAVVEAQAGNGDRARQLAGEVARTNPGGTPLGSKARAFLQDIGRP